VNDLKDGFLVGRSFNGLGEVNVQVMHWLEQKGQPAHPRHHGSAAD
jgi:hypothetical protein